MRIEYSGVGCSVKCLNDLGCPTLSIGYDFDWSAGKNKAADMYTPHGLRAIVKELKRGIDGPTGLCIFADNLENGHGTRLAAYLRKQRYRVDSTPTYINHNHDSECKMWTWYFSNKLPLRVKENVKRYSHAVRGATKP